MGFHDFLSDNSAVSETIGKAIILGFIATIGVGLLIASQTLLTETPHEEASFDVEFTTLDNGEMKYVSGEEFSSDDTERLFIIGETRNGNTYRKTIYEDGQLTHGRDNDGRIEVNDTVLYYDNGNNGNTEIFKPGSASQIVWEPRERNAQIVVDEIVIPDESVIIRRTAGGGGNIVAGGDIIIEGSS